MNRRKMVLLGAVTPLLLIGAVGGLFFMANFGACAASPGFAEVEAQAPGERFAVVNLTAPEIVAEPTLRAMFVTFLTHSADPRAKWINDTFLTFTISRDEGYALADCLYAHQSSEEKITLFRYGDATYRVFAGVAAC